MKSNNKNTLILIIVLAALLAIAYPMLKGEEVVMENAAAPVGSEASAVLSRIESVDLNTSVEKMEAFQSLIDFTGPFLTLPVGKTNPFQ